MGLGQRCSRPSSRSRTTSTTAATVCTAAVARSRSPGRRSTARAPFDVSMVAAMTELGYPTCDDYHTPGSTGISRWALTLRDGRRMSTNDAYLEPARSRPNLSVRGDVLVDRILLDGRRAVGVRTADGEEIAARRGDRERRRDPLAGDPVAIRYRYRRRSRRRREPQGSRSDARIRGGTEASGPDGFPERRP